MVYKRPLSSDELYHFGIKGMKWGARRYQNEDGSYTSAGHRQYDIGEQGSKKKKGLSDSQKTAIKVGIGLVAAGLAAYGGYKLHKIHIKKQQEKVIANYMKAAMFPEIHNPKASSFVYYGLKRDFAKAKLAAQSFVPDADDIKTINDVAKKTTQPKVFKTRSISIPKASVTSSSSARPSQIKVSEFSSTSSTKSNLPKITLSSLKRKPKVDNSDWMGELDNLNDDLLKKNRKKLKL